MVATGRAKHMAGWSNISGLEPKDFVCGHCGRDVSPNLGYVDSKRGRSIYVCHRCGKPNYFDHEDQVPGALFGGEVNDIPDEAKDVGSLYDEARQCASVNAYTAAVLCCRKLLMNVAVSKGADEGQTFAAYVSFLSDKNFVPPDAKEWVDHIRKVGNIATHEIQIMDRDIAEELITFSEMLLKIIYEFPAIASRRKGPAAEPEVSGE